MSIFRLIAVARVLIIFMCIKQNFIYVVIKIYIIVYFSYFFNCFTIEFVLLFSSFYLCSHFAKPTTESNHAFVIKLVNCADVFNFVPQFIQTFFTHSDSSFIFVSW